MLRVALWRTGHHYSMRRYRWTLGRSKLLFSDGKRAFGERVLARLTFLLILLLPAR